MQKVSTQLASRGLHVVGKGGRVLVVKGAPTPVELLRGEPFVNDDRGALQAFVLDPLGLTRDDVMLAWSTDVALTTDFARACNFDVVIDMSGRNVVTKGDAWRNIPSLEVLRIEPHRAAEMTRKLSSVRKKLDATAHRMQSRINLVHKGATPSDAGTILAPIYKRAQSQQIVFGVVLDPYDVDTQNDWSPPAEIEKTAYGYMMKSRTIGIHHAAVAPDAVLIDSTVEQYPSEDDREKAHANLPHRAFKRKYGDDVVHSGSWIIGVKLSDRLWKLAESGEFDAFSIGGFGIREPIERLTMPLVTFVELGEVKRVVGRTSNEAK